MLLIVPQSADFELKKPNWVTTSFAPVIVTTNGKVARLKSSDEEILLQPYMEFQGRVGVLVSAGKSYTLQYWRHGQWQDKETFTIERATGQMGFFVELPDKRRVVVDIDLNFQSFSFTFDSPEVLTVANIGVFAGNKESILFEKVALDVVEKRLEYTGRWLYKYKADVKIKNVQIYGLDYTLDEDASVSALIEFVRRSGGYFYLAENGFYVLPPSAALFAPSFDYGDFTESFVFKPPAVVPKNIVAYWWRDAEVEKKIKDWFKALQADGAAYNAWLTQAISTTPKFYLATNLTDCNNWQQVAAPITSNFKSAAEKLGNPERMFFIFTGIPTDKAAKLYCDNEVIRASSGGRVIIIGFARSKQGIEFEWADDKDIWFYENFLRATGLTNDEAWSSYITGGFAGEG